MTLSIEFILGIIGTTTGVTSLAVSVYFNRRAIEQTDKNLKSQLLYHDRKQALMSLQKIIDESKNLYELNHNQQIFSNSFEGNYIPGKVFEKLNDEFKYLKEFYDVESPYPTNEVSEEEYNYHLKMGHIPIDPYENMNEYDKFEHNLKNKIDYFRVSAKKIINDSLKEV